MKFAIKLVLRAGVVVLTLANATLVPAQQSGNSQTRRVPPDTMQRELERHDLLVKVLEDEARRPVERRAARLAFAQINEDFMRIQILNNNLALAVVEGRLNLDLKFIAKSAGEIRKRAERLKDNLALPAPEKGSRSSTREVGEEAEQLKASLSTLRELILKFVSNPGFQSVEVVDAQLSLQARRDLEGIIAVSEQVKKWSEKLNKAAP